MRAVIQRVSQASCTVEGTITGQIEAGFLVLLGIEDADTQSVSCSAREARCIQKFYCGWVFNQLLTIQQAKLGRIKSRWGFPMRRE